MTLSKQPVCDDCFRAENPGINPHRSSDHEDDRDREQCCICGVLTWSGIYVAKDPTSVPYPRLEREGGAP